MLVYKVVKVINDAYWSSNGDRNFIEMGDVYIQPLDNKIAKLSTLQYVIDQTTVPLLKGSKLFCFDTMENALTYINECCINIYYRILECEATDVTTEYPCYCKGKIKNHWEGKSDPSIDIFFIDGSLGAGSITPIRQIDPNDYVV